MSYRYKKRKISLLGQKYLIVRRNFGWYHRKYGIVLDYLLDTQIRLLKEHRFIRDIATDEQSMYIVFQTLEMEDKNKGSRKLWFNPYTNKATDYRTLIKNSKDIEWKCAICDIDIISHIDNFKPENFLCNTCNEIYNTPNKKIDGRIVDASVKFTKYCKEILRKEQKQYMSYTKKNIKITLD